MSSTTEQEYVTFFAGGIKGIRPILRDADLKPTFDSIPIVDFTDIYSPSLEKRKSLALEVRKAFTDVGFMYAANHGISASLQLDVLRVMEEFFSLADKEKMKIHINKSPYLRGYEQLFETKLDKSSRGGIETHPTFSNLDQVLMRF